MKQQIITGCVAAGLMAIWIAGLAPNAVAADVQAEDAKTNVTQKFAGQIELTGKVTGVNRRVKTVAIEVERHPFVLPVTRDTLILRAGNRASLDQIVPGEVVSVILRQRTGQGIEMVWRLAPQAGNADAQPKPARLDPNPANISGGVMSRND